QYNDSSKRDIDFGNRFSFIQSNFDKSISQQTSNFNSQLTTLNTARQSYENLKDKLLANISLPPESRQRIIEIDKNAQSPNLKTDDLNDWAARLHGVLTDEKAEEQIQREKSLKAAQDYYELNLPYFLYSVATFTNLTSTASAQMGDM